MNDSFLQSINDVCYSLISLMLIVSKKTDTFFNNIYAEKLLIFDSSDQIAVGEINTNENIEFGNFFSRVVEYMMKMYNDLSNDEDVTNILLSLLIHFKHIIINYKHMKALNYHILFQVLFSTISAIENYLLKNYKRPKTNMDIYAKLNRDTIISVITNLKDSMKRALRVKPKMGEYNPSTIMCIFGMYDLFVNKIDFKKKVIK